MNVKSIRRWIAPLFLLIMIAVAVLAPAQTAQPKTLVVTGHTGEAEIIQARGRNYVDLEKLVQILNGSLGYQGSRIVLVLPSIGTATRTEAQTSPAVAQAEAQSSIPDDNRFSKGFVDAAIEALGSMRDWATNLGVIIKKGYPVSNATIEKWRGPAMKNFALANSAVSNDADRRGLQLLTTEYNNLQDWSAKLVEARKSMSAANYSMSDDALLNDPVSQKILTCWKFLGPMLARGTFEDDGSCR